jgi:hypothetical protein
MGTVIVAGMNAKFFILTSDAFFSVDVVEVDVSEGGA